MKLTNLSAENFWSYNKLNFSFDQGLCLVEGINLDEQGSNGAGKSAIFNAVCFALFGDVPKSVKIDSVINRNQAGACVVTIDIEEDNDKYQIIRGRSPNVLKFLCNGQSIADIDTKKTQKLIESKLNLSYSTFIHSVYFAQNSVNFLVLNDEQKKQVLTDLLNLKVFDKSEELVKRELSIRQADLNTLSSEIHSRESVLKTFESQLVSVKTQNKYYADEQKRKIDNLINEINECKLSSDKHHNRELELNQLLESTRQSIDSFKSEKHNISNALEVVEANLADLDRSTIAINERIKFEQRAHDSLNLSESICNSCKQEVNFSLLDKHKGELILTIQSLKNELNVIANNRLELPSKNEIDQKKRDLARKESDLSNSLLMIQSDLSNTRILMANASRRLEELTTLHGSIQSETNPYATIIGELEKNQQDTEKQIAILKSDQALLVKTIEDLTFIREVFSNKGIKSYVFDTVINELNIRVNQYLSNLFSNDVRLRFLSESITGKGDVKQCFSVEYLKNNEAVELGSFSGGEERRIIFAIQLAMADIIASRSNRFLNVAFFDEAFDGMDFEGKQQCMRLLQSMSASRDCILVIDHTSEFASSFDAVIKVQKQNGISSIQ